MCARAEDTKARHRARAEEAKARRLALKAAEAERQERKREVERKITNRTDEVVEAQWIKDSGWYLTYYQTLKGSLQREIKNDATEYMERLYRELILWKKAGRPSVSPLVHPEAVFHSLSTTANSITDKILFTVGYAPLMEQYRLLSAVANELRSCVLDLGHALEEEDAIDEDTPDLQTVQERYSMKRLRFFNSELTRVVEDSGL
ncbi:hypothetical protein PM082_024253 [Marasmius tenuissimus]|nr:hypothetical protein PM082_024253 [Marasmius tenuissimus]